MKSLVVGAGGLIGAAIGAELKEGQYLHPLQRKIRWTNPGDAREDLRSMLTEFRNFVADDSWTIFWCAGKGHIRSRSSELSNETELLRSALQSLSSWPNRNGVFAICSSAGAIWYSTTGGIITERSPDTGTSPYALAKLSQEALLESTCKEIGIRGVAARISSVYGLNQDLMKSQGLISRLCYSAASQQPLDIFVPLETTRNYLYAHDVARMMRAFTEFVLRAVAPSSFVKKIICSRESQSIAGLCHLVELVSRRKPLISSQITSESVNYPLHFHLRSTSTPDLTFLESTTILSGISVVYQELLRQQQLGKLSR